MSDARRAVDAYALPPPSKYARDPNPERDLAILRMDGAGATLAEIARAPEIQMTVSAVQKRLYKLRDLLADEAEKRARERPGWPRDERCLTCRKWGRREHPGERVCGACKQTSIWRAGDGVRGAVAGIRRGRG